MASNPLLELEHQLTAAAQRRVCPVVTAPRRRRSRRRLALVVAALLLAVGAAAFATVKLLQTGSPVPYRFGRPATAHAKYGIAITGTIHLSSAVADPQGGLPWALRTFHSTRGYGCLQVGLLYQGKLGVLGKDAAFGDDGRFHELRPDAVDGHGSCIPLDARRHPYLAVHEIAMPTSGTQSCHAKAMYPTAPGRICPPEELRGLEYGFAGPDARTVAYRPRVGALRSVATGPEGAYLVVLPFQPPPPIDTASRLHLLSDYSMPSATPASRVIVRVDYRDGSACHVRPTHAFAGGCPAHGPAPFSGHLPSTAAVRTPLRLTVTGRGAAAVLHARFRARVPVTGGASVYDLIVKPERHPSPTSRSTRCRSFESIPIDRDIRVGETVHKDIALGSYRCNGFYRASLSYRVESGTPGPFGPSSKYPGRLVAIARVYVPHR